ncbi:MAG: helix-turn-helix domain-containing protein [Candidatus Omnitrophica bacterium]|nr:helix-turn-helix domain-containing protein [Candidatus Omnitrophota bacterium]
MAEKLLTIAEVAAYLKISEEEVKRLVDMGEIPAYRIGGSFLRFRKEQIDAIRSEIFDFEEKSPDKVKPHLDRKGRPTHPYTDLERDIKRKEPHTRQYDYSTAEKIRDFFYFNDFYILSLFIIGVLLYLIFR